MRLFIALPIPDPILAELAAVQNRLRRSGHPVRWADVMGLHLTLQFLGETTADLVDPLIAALRAIPTPPLALVLAGLGAFPNPQRPRVIWAGVGGETEALIRLQAAVVAATTPFGFASEDRPFKAHLTLGRVRQNARPEQLRPLAAALAAAAPPRPLEWQSAPPTLYQSRLTPQGAIYTALGPGDANASV